MPLSVNEELRRSFERAALSREARFAETPAQWRELAELKIRCAEARARENDLYSERYQARVELRLRQLIDEAGARTRTFRPRSAGADRFSPEDLQRQAQRNVRDAHARRLGRIDVYEGRQQSFLLMKFDAENRQRGVAGEALAREGAPARGPQRSGGRPRDG